MNFAIIKAAGMTQAEFGELPGVRVGRATVNLWVSGKMHPNRYIKASVAEVLGKVDQALKDGRLPLPAQPELNKLAHFDAIVERLQLN